MDRRSFVLGGAAAALHATWLFGARPAVSVELGSIDGSVGGNQFSPIQFLDYLNSIKLTWAMISLPPDLKKALAKAPAAAAKFKTLTAARQKQFLYFMNDAKKEETRTRRIAHILKMLG